MGPISEYSNHRSSNCPAQKIILNFRVRFHFEPTTIIYLLSTYSAVESMALRLFYLSSLTYYADCLRETEYVM